MEWTRRNPVFLLLLPLIAGILCCRYTGYPVDLLQDTEADWLDSLYTFRAVLTDYPQAREKTVRCEAALLARADTAEVLPAEGKVFLYLVPDSAHAARNRNTLISMQIGDTIVVRTRITRAGLLGGFDYGNYLRMQGITGTAVVRKDQWRLFPCRETAWWKLPNPARRVQHTLYGRFRSLGIEGDELATLGALTLGCKEDLDPALRRSFQRSGAAHVLAVSGLHTGIIYAVLLALFTCFGRCKPMYDNRLGRIALSSAVIVCMWGYALLTGMTPSVVRSVLMLSVVEVGRMGYRQAVSLNTLALAALLILLFRPRDLFSVSFQLSFAAVAAILLFGGGLVQVFRLPFPPRFRAGRYVADLLGISVAAQLGTLPVALYCFGQCSNWFMLTNMLVLPLTGLIVVLAFAALCFGGIPVVGTLLASGAKGLAWLLNHTAGWVESLPGATTDMRISAGMAVLLYGAMACGYAGLNRSLWWLVGTAGCLAAFCYGYVIQ